MGDSRISPVRALVAATATGLACLAATTGPAPALQSRGTLNSYTVKIGVKGGESLTSDVGGRYNGDMVQESLSGSFTIDGTIRPMWIFKGKSPRLGEKEGVGYSRPVVKGVWSAQGTKWVDVANEITGPFTCSGTVRTNVEPQMALSWKRTGTKITFSLSVLQQELHYRGFDGCPNDSHAGPVNAADPLIYQTRFSLPLSTIGRRTITKSVSGPLAQNRLYFKQNCPKSAASDCNLAWQGVVRFTRTRVLKAY